ncbi:MAG: hydroxymethylglutaryl-CoA synthase family protein [Polyangiaceae bacterium]|nr:hydroxymethylglutaryl-CoA synthase family protein [Polyangiaceae bacterium]
MSVRVGIEKARVYPTSLALDMGALCAARGHDPADIRDVMMIDQRSVNPPWEDPVTMAVNAALPMLTEEDRRDIALLLVGTESGVDQEKPMSTWVQRYLGLSSRCRNMEVKHACYSGTGSLQLAASFVASGVAGPRAKALVITSDQSRMHLGKPYEFVMGAGAAALVVSRDPRLFELELGRSGIYTNEVSDLTRPTSRVETGNSETSLLSYLEALDAAVAHYLEGLGEPVGYDHFKKNIYHVPFGGMTLRATRAALRHFGEYSKAEARRLWEEKTLPSLAYTRRMGGTYASSTFIALLALIDACEDLRPGDRVGMFSYGSGCCAEFYSGLVGREARAVAAEAKVRELLDQRRPVSVREYEEAERERTCYVDAGDFEPSTDGHDGLYDRRYRGNGYLVFQGIKDHYRRYGWS